MISIIVLKLICDALAQIGNKLACAKKYIETKYILHIFLMDIILFINQFTKYMFDIVAISFLYIKFYYISNCLYINSCDYFIV